MFHPFYYNHLNLKEGEEVKAVLHKHPMTLVKPGLKVLVFAGMPIVILSAFLSANPFILALFFLVLTCSFTYGFFEWYNWYNDVYILTSERIVDIEQKSFFHRVVSETTWDKVQDVTYEVVGVLPTLFDYGTIRIQTAGAKEVICMDQIARPKEWQSKIMEIQKTYEEINKKELTAKEFIEIVQDKKDEFVKKSA